MDKLRKLLLDGLAVITTLHDVDPHGSLSLTTLLVSFKGDNQWTRLVTAAVQSQGWVRVEGEQLWLTDKGRGQAMKTNQGLTNPEEN